MLISVVIPLFNKETTIASAIQSVLNQTHQELEIIVVNDSSTDASVITARKIVDPRIRIVEQQHKGASEARNLGVKYAKSEWVAFLDADDEYMSNFIESIVRFIYQHDECEGSQISFVASNLIYGNTNLPAITNVESGLHSYFKLCKYDRTPATSSSTVVHREAFIKAGGFPEGVKHFEDWILWCKLAWIGKFGFISEPLSIYNILNQGTASTSKRSGEEFVKDIVALRDIISKWMCNGWISDNIARDSWLYINSFVIGQAKALATMNEKAFAVKLLLNINIVYVDIMLILMFIKTIIIIILPVKIQKMVKLYRASTLHARNNRSRQQNQL